MVNNAKCAKKNINKLKNARNKQKHKFLGKKCYFLLKYFWQSIAAMHPSPAAVMACLYL